MEDSTSLLSSNDLAADRTWLAHERTLMAWVRTATSMISFGFTIYKFFEGHPRNPNAILTSRDFAILMIAFGLGSLVLATIQHVIEVKPLKKQMAGSPRSLALLLSILISVLGLVALLSAALRG